MFAIALLALGILWTGPVAAQGAYPQTAQTGQADTQKLFQQAVEAQQRGDDGLAVGDYRALLRLHPEAAAVRVNLGTALAHWGHYNEAIEQYQIVLSSDPANRLARTNMAQAYRGSGDMAHAVSELERLHHDDPKDGQAAMLLADSYAQSGRDADAVALLLPLEHAKPADPELEWLLGLVMIHSGRVPEGVERVEKSGEKSSNAEAYLLAGHTRFGMTQYDRARRDADAALRLNPKLPGLASLRGMISEQTADYDGAEAALEQALAEDPNDFNANFYLGANFYFKRNMVQARAYITRALEIQLASSQARYELALIDRADGKLDDALRNLQTVIGQLPDWMEPHVELSALYYHMQRPDDGAREKQIVDRMMAALQQSQAKTAN